MLQRSNSVLSFAFVGCLLLSACNSEPGPGHGAGAPVDPGAGEHDVSGDPSGELPPSADPGTGAAEAIGLALLLPDELEEDLPDARRHLRPDAEVPYSGPGDTSGEAELALEEAETGGPSTIGAAEGVGGRFGSRQGERAPSADGPSSPGPSGPTSAFDSLGALGYGGGIGGGSPGEVQDRRVSSEPVLNDAEGGELAFGEAQQPEDDAEADGDGQQPWQRAGAGANATRLRVGDEDELPLIGMQATVWVEGFRARVVLDCMYHNDREQNLEGDFRVRLPEGASPYYFAFGGSEEREGFEPSRPQFDDDIDGRRGWTGDPLLIRDERAALWSEPKEARMVARERAAFAYGETVRRQIDPALLEWAGAGVFNARVFPLMPGSQARVVLGYEVELADLGEALEYVLEVPADVPALAVDLFVAADPSVPVLVSPAATPWLDGSRQHYSWPATSERRFVARVDDIGAMAMTSPTSVDEDWFATRLAPELPLEEDRSGGPAVIAFDTSLSSRDSFARWAELAPALLDDNQESISSFAVLFFDVEQRWWRSEFTPNEPGAVDALRRELQDVWLEGASDLESALSVASAPPWQGFGAGRPWDVFLFSDGAPTWGEAGNQALQHAFESGSGRKLFAYNVGAAAPPASLQHLARETGGAVFQVGNGAAGLEAAVRAHRFTPWVIEGVSLSGTRDLLLSGRPQSLYPGQTLKLVGRGRPRAGQEVELSLSRSGVARSVRIPLARVVESELCARAYGEVAVAQLEEWGTALEEQAIPFARHFRVTASSCSLLMLESEEDYESFGIEHENDALAVRGADVGGLIAQLLARRGAELDDPQQGLLAWLQRLESAPGLTWEAPEGMFESFGALPVDSFQVPRTELTSSTHDGADLADELRQALVAEEPVYDELFAAAEARLAADGPAGALRLFSSLVELSPGDGVVARDVGFAAMSWGLADHAYHLFRRVSVTRPWEPQSYHAMARCMEAAGKVELAQLWYEVALAGSWQGRFGNFDEICGLDYLRLLRRIDSGAVESGLTSWSRVRLPVVTAAYQPEEADILVTITWNTDRTDVDLHVREPNGEVCMYSNKNTEIGGRLTRDVTQGFGPEMYVLENAINGDYRILAHYFRADGNRTNVRTKVYARIYLGWGSEHEEVRDVVVPLVSGGQFHDIGVVRCEK